MRVCIPIEFQAQGGGFYFLDQLTRYLHTHDSTVTKRIDESYDVLFTNHWMTPPADILRAVRHNPNLRVVQRIDGSAQDYGREAEADTRQGRVNELADLTIFQSEYSRYATRIKFPVIKQDGPIIYNPVDTDLFTPDGSRRGFAWERIVVCLTWSINAAKGASSIYAVANANPDIDFVLCGNYPDAPDLLNVHKLGFLSREELAEVLRSSQILLTFSQNEACPNHVLEALASGLPVLYSDSGAAGEIVGDCGLAVTVDNFRAQFAKIATDIEHYSLLARERAVLYFDPNVVLSKYLEELQAVCERPPKGPVFWRSFRAWLDPITRLAR